MSNLTSTVPGAFNALYSLIAAAGQAQNPVIPVFHSEVLTGQQTENGYVLLSSVERHRYQLAALGSYAHYELYDICGCASYFQGGPDPLTMVETVLDGVWGIYENVVMATVVANRGANGTYVLGSGAPVALEYILPVAADYTGGVSSSGDGFTGEVVFRFEIKARITVP